jgi:hypothetical protein
MNLFVSIRSIGYDVFDPASTYEGVIYGELLPNFSSENLCLFKDRGSNLEETNGAISLT